jgi:hypothetical protein
LGAITLKKTRTLKAAAKKRHILIFAGCNQQWKLLKLDAGNLRRQPQGF